MRFADFRALVERLVQQVPRDFLDGVVAIDASPKTVPHPLRAEVYTLGECIPLEWSGDGSDLQSRILLYHGSFAELARRRDLDWRQEVWDTLTHELRHHLEWRANVQALERYDWAAEQNFARHEGEPFDPAFHRAGEEVAPGIYKVDDDVFVELAAPAARPAGPVEVPWHGRRYRVTLPEDVRPPAFLTLEGLVEPPPGEAVLVLPGRASLARLWRRPRVTTRAVPVEAVDG